MPLDVLIELTTLDHVKQYRDDLRYSGVHIVGVGLNGRKPDHLNTKCWMYFPEDNCPFYRGTVFSNYSKHNVPDHTKQWSLMMEVSESPFKPVNHDTIRDDVVQGLLNTTLIKSKDDIASLWYHYEDHGYPTPFLERNEILEAVLPEFEKHSIYSRGRFGAWKYEVANQDHSMMQGVEVVNHILNGEDEVTLHHPEIVNKR